MSEPLLIPRPLLGRTFEVFRACGQERDECVAILTAPQGSHTIIDVLHPDHSASPRHYEVDGRWMTQFFAHLREVKQTAVAQVHTHAGRAFHSTTDDRFPLVPAIGFVSIVVPNFGGGPVSLDGMYVAVLEENGWRSVDPASALQVIDHAG